MKKYNTITAWLTLLLCIFSLVPLLILGTYNHPTGDDYYYGVETAHIWQETHNLFAVLKEAAKGVGKEYQIWQGTYSAMFLMYLPPNLFGEKAYHLVTPVLLFLLLGGIFFLTHALLRRLLHASVPEWIALASVLSILCIQTTPFASEAYFWYNGSMYYTGYLAITLFYFGILLRMQESHGIPACVLACLLAFFLAGGNYVSLLPTMLLSIAFAALAFLPSDKASAMNPTAPASTAKGAYADSNTLSSPAKRASVNSNALSLPAKGAYADSNTLSSPAKGSSVKRAWLFLLPCFSLLAGFLISALAPGNRVRQSGMWKISAVKAILKSLRQGLLFLYGFNSLWLLAALLLLTPILWKICAGSKCRFRYPALVIGFSYGILCSTTCPTFYTMNSTGPARAAAIMYDVFLIFVLFSYGYLLGYLQRVLREKTPGRVISKMQQFLSGKSSVIWALAALLILLPVLILCSASLNCVRAKVALQSGDAKAYEAQYQERLAALYDDSIKEIVFSPYETTADLLYVGDFSSDPLDPTNERVAEYFYKNSVIVRYD